MFWILRRTGAANFFNSLNNNCSSSKGRNSSSTQDKCVKRWLSADLDDASSQQKHKIDDPFDEFDNFKIITSGSGYNNGNDNAKCQHGCVGENRGGSRSVTAVI